MKKLFFLLLSGLMLFNACGPAEDLANEITDPEGVEMSLTWTNSATHPESSTDLELYVVQNFNYLIQSTKYNAFESVEITPGLLNNGTYSVEVYVDNISLVTNYKITLTGKSTGKTYTASFGPINANDNNTSLKPLSLTVSGNKYSIY